MYEAEDVRLLADAALDFWLTAGRFNEAFEQRLAEFMGLKHALMINSGSSALLAAFSALTSSWVQESGRTTRRRGYYRGDGFSCHGQPDSDLPVGPGLRGHADPNLQHRPRPA